MAHLRLAKTPIRWPPKAIFFDLDGTLVDSAPDVLAAFAHAFEKLGAETPAKSELLSVIGLRLEECFARFPAVGPARSAEGARHFRRHYRDHYLDATRPYPGIPKSVRELEARYRLGLATMKKGEFARAMVRAFGWLGTFQRVIGAEDGYPAKPDPTMLQALCRAYDIRPDEAVYVGDTALDVRMAAAAKVPVFWVSYGYGAIGEEEAALVNGVVDSPGSLWKILMDAWSEPLPQQPEPPPRRGPSRPRRPSPR